MQFDLATGADVWNAPLSVESDFCGHVRFQDDNLAALKAHMHNDSRGEDRSRIPNAVGVIVADVPTAEAQ
jgi:hypothetical protein